MSSSLRTNWNECFCLRSNTECIPAPSFAVGLEKPRTAVTACVKLCYISCRCLNQMTKDGLSVDDVFSQCVFRQDERDMVLRAVHIVQPDYHPSVNANTSQCSPALVQDYYIQVSQAGVLCYRDCSSSSYLIFNGVTGLTFVCMTASVSSNTAAL